MKKIKNLKPILDLALSREKMKSIMGGYGPGCGKTGDPCQLIYGGGSTCCADYLCISINHGPYFCNPL